jgi:prolyl 4-hydroxylase
LNRKPKGSFDAAEDEPRPQSRGPQQVELETLSLSPLVFSVTGFLGAAECAHIIAAAEPSMVDSGVDLMDEGRGEDAPTTHFGAWRTSTQVLASSRPSLYL